MVYGFEIIFSFRLQLVGANRYNYDFKKQKKKRKEKLDNIVECFEI